MKIIAAVFADAVSLAVAAPAWSQTEPARRTSELRDLRSFKVSVIGEVKTPGKRIPFNDTKVLSSPAGQENFLLRPGDIVVVP